MKSSLLIFVIGIFLQCQAIRDKVFRPRREYIYQYEAQLVTGMEPFTTVHSGFRLSAAARVQFTTLSKVRVQFEKLIIYRLNKPVVQLQADSNILPEQFLKEFAGDETNKILYFLRIPFGFQYVKGHVVRVLLSNEETEWSANAKRGFVSLFEVNLEKRMLLQQISQASDNVADQKVDNYKAMERAVTGECATTYTVKSTPSANHFFVSKVRDFETCLEKPVYLSTIFDGYYTPNRQKDNPVSTGATVEYSLRGSTTRFLILTAIAQTRIDFTPSDKQGDIRTLVNQTLYLKDAGPIAAKTAVPEIVPDHKRSNSLRMTLPSKAVDPQDPFQASAEEAKQVENPSDVYPVDAIHIQLVQAAENTQRLTSEEALVRLRVVVSMLKTSPEVIIRELWQKIYNPREVKSEDQLAAKALWNVLPHVGTEEAAAHILNVCTNDLTMRRNCSATLSVLTLKVTPTTNIIQKLIALIETHTVKDTQDKLKQVSYLALGSLSYRLSRAKHWKLEEINKVKDILARLDRRDSNRFVRRYLAGRRRDANNRKNRILNTHAHTNHIIVQTIKKLLDQCDQAERILALKSLANAGETESLSILKRIISNNSEPAFIRIFAVTGLRRMHLDEATRQDAIGALLAVYQNNKESKEIRTAAFSTLMGLRPEEPVLSGISRSLHYEKDVHVSQYVISYLGSVANSSYTALWERNKRCRDALKFAPSNHNVDLYHSFRKSIGKMYPEYKAGVDLWVSFIGSIVTYEGWSFGMDTYIHGLHSSFFEINSEGISSFLNKLVGPKGSHTDSKSGLVPADAVTAEIFRLLHVKARTDSMPTAPIYYKMMGHELVFTDFTDILNAISSQGQAAMHVDPVHQKIRLPVQYEDMWYLQDTQLTLPSEAGLPVSLKLQLSTTVKADGLLTASNPLSYLFRSNRQSQDPLTLTASVDLKPKLVTALYGSMGLDWHYLKPTLAFRGLIENSMPFKSDMTYDIDSQKFKTVNFVPKMSKPMVKVLIEPFGEFQVLSAGSQAPTVRTDRTSIFTPVGSKLIPINLFYSIDVLGYKVGVQGQIPDQWGMRSPFQPLGGRTVLDFYMSPLDQAPHTITIQGQIVQPLLNISGSPTGSEPVDLEKETVSLRQLVAKMEQVTGKALPSTTLPGYELTGLVMTADASTDKVTRKSQLDVLWGRVNEGHDNVGMLHLWRSPIQGYDDKEWEVSSSLETSYPHTQYGSKDIFSEKWQRQLMRDLHYFVSAKTYKVANEVLNRTLLSDLEQFNYPAMARVPAYKVARALVPQVLYKLKRHIYYWSWTKYWKTLGPLSHKVEEEKKLLLDPYFINRDAILFSYLTELSEVQKTLVKDLESVTWTYAVRHAVLPAMQWVVFSQERVVYSLDEIVTRNTARRAITKVKKIKKMLKRSKKLLDEVLKKSRQIISNSASMSQETNNDGFVMVAIVVGSSDQQFDKSHPHYGVVSENNAYMYHMSERTYNRSISDLRISPDHLKNVDEPKQNKAEFKDDVSRFDDVNVRRLIRSLCDLSAFQMQVVENIQQSISQNKLIDKHLLYGLVNSTRQNLTLYDDLWRQQKPLDLEIIKERMLLITIQNELLVDLLHQHHTLVHKMPEMQKSFIDTEIFDLFDAYFVKVASYYFGQRSASIFRQTMTKYVVEAQLNNEELKVYRRVQGVFRNLAVDLRMLESSVTTRSSDLNRIFSWFSQSINRYINKISSAQKAVVQIDSIPKVYVVSELVETINYMRFAVDVARSANLPLTIEERLFWIQTFDNQATDIQVLLSSMSAIFDKFSKSTAKQGPASEVLTDLPMDPRLVSVQRLLPKQVELTTELRRIINSKEDLTKEKVTAAVKRTHDLFATIFGKGLEVYQAWKQKDIPGHLSIFALFTKVTNQQRQLYEVVEEILSQADEQDFSDTLYELKVPDTTGDFFNAAEFWINKTLEEYKSQPNMEDDPQLSASFISTGPSGLLNITWGPKDDKQQIKVQMSARRSLEQIVWIFKQMDAIVRSEDVINDINYNLGEQAPSGKETLGVLNTFNHLHFITSLDKVRQSDWVKEYSSRLQDFFKMAMWEQYSWRQPEPDQGNRHQVILDISDFNKKMDIILMDKWEINKFLSVPLPQWLPAVKGNQYTKSVPQQLASYLSPGCLPAQCAVEENQVKTVDSVEYYIPRAFDKCATVLAMDCSRDQTFSISMVKSKIHSNGYDLHVASYNSYIEIHPRRRNVRFTDNGKEFYLKESEPMIWSEQVQPGLRSTFLVITRNEMKVEVKMPLIGLHVTFEISYIKVEFPQLLRHKVCGLCGNFEGPLQEVYTSPISFVSSYVIPDDKCPINPVSHQESQETVHAAMAATAEFVPSPEISQKPMYQTPSSHLRDTGVEEDPQVDDELDENADRDDVHRDNVGPVYRTDIRLRQAGNQVCYSQIPQLICPQDAHVPAKTRMETVVYICVDRKDFEEAESNLLGPQPDLDNIKHQRISRRVHRTIEC